MRVVAAMAKVGRVEPRIHSARFRVSDSRPGVASFRGNRYSVKKDKTRLVGVNTQWWIIMIMMSLSSDQ